LRGASVEKIASFGQNIKTNNLARLAFGNHLQGVATDFAVGGEPLIGLVRIQQQLKALSAEWALDCLRNFHRTRAINRIIGMDVRHAPESITEKLQNPKSRKTSNL
jgi:hypothetical protein